MRLGKLMLAAAAISVTMAALVTPVGAASQHPMQLPAPPLPRPPAIGSVQSSTPHLSLSSHSRSTGLGPDFAVGGVINCYLNVQNPHSSSHVPGTVNVAATVNCDADVAWDCIQVALWSDNDQAYVADSGCVVQGLGNGGYVNAATTYCPLQPGWYIGWGYTDVIAPPGYQPQEATASGFGNWAYVTVPCS